MNRSILILVIAGVTAIFIALIIALGIFFFGKRPAPEQLPIGAPTPSPRSIFGITLPTKSFFIHAPASTPFMTPVSTPPARIAEPSPSPAASPLRSPTPAPTPTPPPPTSQQVFDFLWPREYRDYLAYLQDSMIQLGALSIEERSSLNTEEEIIKFLMAGVDYLAQERIIAESDVQNFKKGISVDLRARKSQEYQLYLQFAPLYPSPLPLPMPSPPADAPMTLGRAIVSIFTGAFRGLWAQDDCYAVRRPNWPIPGFSLWAPICYGYAWKIPIGCLNAVCVTGNAIWDRTTGICGCD